MNILAIDIGGTHIKFTTQRRAEPVKIDSGPKMTPERMVAEISEATGDWKYDRVAVGYPGPVVHNRPLREPYNLAPGWVRYRFQDAFQGKPLRMLNDAAMQALGSYQGGRMLFIGVGTGLGSAMVVDGVVQAMELAHLPWRKGKTYEDYLGAAGLKKYGKKIWRKRLEQVLTTLGEALEPEYIVLGGGNAKLLEDLPKNVLLGDNEHAFTGAFRMWQKLR